MKYKEHRKQKLLLTLRQILRICLGGVQPPIKIYSSDIQSVNDWPPECLLHLVMFWVLVPMNLAISLFYTCTSGCRPSKYSAQDIPALVVS
jgi:hypothetical protein